VSLSSNFSLELKLAPVVLSPEVTTEILSSHKHSLLWALSTGDSLAICGLLLETYDVRSSNHILKKRQLDFVWSY